MRFSFPEFHISWIWYQATDYFNEFEVRVGTLWRVPNISNATMWLISLRRTQADTTTILFLCRDSDGRRILETSFCWWLADGSFLIVIVGLYVHARLLCPAATKEA